ncbi:hypothetical protein Tco_1582061, partial [Tanacetum coccineum]
ILTPATTLSSSLQNLPDFASLFGFDNILKALEDNFSKLKQANQYAEVLSSIPGIVDQYLANKLKEAVDVAVQLKYDRIREETHTKNQQFLDSIDEGMKKVIKEQVKKEVSKITPNIEKLVNEQLEYEVLVRSSKEAKMSHAVAAILSEIELDTVIIKRPRDGVDDDQEPSAGTDPGSKRRRSEKNLNLPVLQEKRQPRQQERLLQEFETGVHDEQAEEEVQHLPNWFQQPTRLPSPDHAWNKSVPAPLPLVPNSQDHGCRLRAYQMDRRLSAQLNVESNTTNSPSGESHIGEKSEDSSMHLRPQGNHLVTSTQKDGLLLSQRWK